MNCRWGSGLNKHVRIRQSQRLITNEHKVRYINVALKIIGTITGSNSRKSSQLPELNRSRQKSLRLN